MENCNFGARTFPASLCVMALLKSNDSPYPPSPGVHRDVVLENNRILGADESAIFAAGVDGLTIRDNVIEEACRRGREPDGDAAIRVLNCARVVLAGNTVDPTRQGMHFSRAVLETPVVP